MPSWLSLARLEFLSEKIPAWKTAADARRRFHLTAVPQQSHWSSAKQPDDSVVTQVAAQLLVKNRTPGPLALARASLVSPKIHGEIVIMMSRFAL